MKFKNTILCVMETFIVNIIVYFIFYQINPNQDEYLYLNPHPLFILCIIIGLIYGNKLGLLTAAICSGFYLIVFLKINKDISLLFIYFRNYKYVLLFFFSAAILGNFRDSYKANIQKMINEKLIMSKNYKSLEKSYNLSQKALEELKKQIINSEESILYLYEIASRLETFNLEEIFTETIGILSKFLKAKSVSIYTYDEKSGYMRLKINFGEESRNRSMLVKNSIGFSSVIINQKVLKWVDIKEKEFPLMSAPLIKESQTIAVVNVDSMDFDNLSEYAYQLFKLIIEWVNKALNQAILVDEISDSKYIEGTRIMKYRYFAERIKSEERRKSEFGMEYSILQYDADNMSIQEINKNIAGVLRSVDIISYSEETKEVYILLPATPENATYLVEERIKNKLNIGKL